MVYPLADPDGIGPDELLGVVQPPRLEPFLADRADAVCEDGVVRNRDVLQLRGLCRRGRARGRPAVFALGHMVLVDGLTTLDPVLVISRVSMG